MELYSQVKIMADSTCSLSGPILQKYEIGVTPLYINMGGKAYRDGIDITQDDIYAFVEKTGELPKTAAVTVQDYLEAFSPYVKEGRSVVHFTISSDMSCCYQNAVCAAKELGNVFVVDSRSLSSGIGLLVLKGAELAAQGMKAQDIKKEMDRLSDKVEASFVIDTLKYLHRGGRCSSIAALGANLLSLKPCIEVKNGDMTVGKKYRGSLEKCLTSYVTDRLHGRTDLDLSRVFITHTVMPPHLCEHVEKLIRGLAPFREILNTGAGSTISNHCGPGTLGILFLHK